MQKTVWIINQYATTPETGLRGRHYIFAKELAKKGYKVYLIAGGYSHLMRTPPKLVDDITIEDYEGFHFVWNKLPVYAQAHNKQRVLNWFLFWRKLRQLPKHISDAPDVIYYSSLSLIGYLGAEYLAKHFKVRLVFEVRDIWPLTLTEIQKVSTKHPFVVFLQWIENRAYKKADAVISNLRNAVEHMVKHGLDKKKFTWIPNGVSLDDMPDAESDLPLALKEQLPQDKFVIGYTGTIGLANALDQLMGAAKNLRDNSRIHFLFVGNGPDKERLKNFVCEYQLSNITFIDAVPKAQVQVILKNYVDVCFIGWHDEPLYRFGIGANKLAEYLYSGKPVLHAYSGACDPVLEAQAGISVPAGDIDSLTKSILKFESMTDADLDLFGERGKRYAQEFLDYQRLTDKLIGVLFPSHSLKD